ncbi:hypothetical protein L1987_29849 [Smallanthus sonchifolius]|uniref:Uncharacterized protein n=1 Tax=Smallanthus sonchifolius TaxID=185202 RepID=A0ACB9I156_9ASTR|nr:hypothetical protein L1987_29849 [Smallanthus sonchifolius]
MNDIQEMLEVCMDMQIELQQEVYSIDHEIVRVSFTEVGSEDEAGERKVSEGGCPSPAGDYLLSLPINSPRRFEI